MEAATGANVDTEMSCRGVQVRRPGADRREQLHRAYLLGRSPQQTQLHELMTQKSNIEADVVSDNHRVTEKATDLICGCHKLRLVTENVICQAVNAQGMWVRLPARVEYEVQRPPGWRVIHDFDSGKTDHPVAGPRRQTGSFAVYDDVTFRQILRCHR
ncbi:protein of unknown function (plasmid) [Azospirillum baldaniorum]|uniref:Uncharacterized protein n=1 Tax=Azospirillum baldaniorum TaxID=1064539 RepID=A0A9P1JV68_9PROT|nr:protein of unknown function [Azospirillum baldaniorum]